MRKSPVHMPRSSALAAGAAAAVLLLSACAQTPQPALPGWAQGRPAEMSASTLSPHAPRLTITPAESVPVWQLKLPPGFAAELWAHGLPGARMMTRGEQGTVFVGTRAQGRVYAVADRGTRREVSVVAQGLTQPNGVAFRDGSLYVAAINQVLRFDAIESRLAAPPVPINLTTQFNLPADAYHGWKFLAFGPDGKLYIPVGAPCNICAVDTSRHAHIRRYNPDGSAMEVVARGVRNSVGFAFHPRTGELWFTDNGRDWAGPQGPQDELNRVAVVGANFGFPYCHANGIADTDVRKPDPCAGVTQPAALMGHNTAALGMRFYTGQMFPAAYRESVFVARRGSWNRDSKTGFDVVAVRVGADGQNAEVTPFLSGLLDLANNTFHGRPADVLQLPDGSLLVSDEQNGAIYRIVYRP